MCVRRWLFPGERKGTTVTTRPLNTDAAVNGQLPFTDQSFGCKRHKSQWSDSTRFSLYISKSHGASRRKRVRLHSFGSLLTRENIRALFFTLTLKHSFQYTDSISLPHSHQHHHLFHSIHVMCVACSSRVSFHSTLFVQFCHSSTHPTTHTLTHEPNR